MLLFISTLIMEHSNWRTLLKRLLNYLSSVRYIGYYVALVGLFLSLVFSFVVYPKIAIPYHAVLDTDSYGVLGYGLWKNGTLSYFPHDEPTVHRGPTYPIFIAFLLMITDGWWPYSVQAAQCFLFGLTCLMVFWISKTLWGIKVAVLSSILCAFHPFLIWYTSRIWIETLATFLFTALIAGILYLSLRPTIPKAVIVGCILGISALCKATFLPFIVIVPLLLGYLKDKKIGWRFLSCIFLISLMFLLPWSIRNLNLTGKIIPVHSRGGLNLYTGDCFVENYAKSPFSSADLFEMCIEKIYLVESSIPGEPKGWERDVLSDSIFLSRSVARYVDNPRFFFKKLVLNSWMYWTLGETEQKSAVISLLQIPLLMLFILSGVKILKHKGIRTIQGVHISLVLLYFMFHLPIVAMARLSVVLVPTMLTTALGILKPVLNGEEDI